ncbi:hypothetical protein ACVWWQ_000166 [Rhodanobacter sp. TND4EL1]
MSLFALCPRLTRSVVLSLWMVVSGHACTAVQEPPEHVAVLVTPMPSEHGVGRRLLTWTDATRIDPDTASGKRELAGWLYYPSIDVPALAGVALDGAWATAARPGLERKLGVAAAHAMLNARWHAGAGAVAPGRFPVVIFAPGHRQLPTSYSALLEGLASRGYAVLAIASPGISEVVPLPGQRFAFAQPLDDESYDTVAQDIASAIAELSALDVAPGEPWTGHLEMGRVGAFGHSVGGAAAILASARVAEVRAAANLDGDFMGAAADARPHVPLLYVSSQPPGRAAQPISDWSSEHNEVRRDRVWRSVASQSPRAFRVRVAGMFHANFEDFALLPPAAMPRKLRENNYGSISGARGLDLTTRLLAAFFAETLGGPPTKDVQAVVAQFPESAMQVLAAPVER